MWEYTNSQMPVMAYLLSLDVGMECDVGLPNVLLTLPDPRTGGTSALCAADRTIFSIQINAATPSACFPAELRITRALQPFSKQERHGHCHSTWLLKQLGGFAKLSFAPHTDANCAGAIFQHLHLLINSTRGQTTKPDPKF